MTKYCIMRECENIHSWISLSGDLAFSHQDVIYGFKFPKRFLEISSRDLTSSSSFLLQLIWRPEFQSIGACSLCIFTAQCLPNSSHTFSQCIFTWCWRIFDPISLGKILELWSYKFSTIVMYTAFWPRVSWQPDLGVFSCHTYHHFSSILTSSTRLETVSMTFRSLNSYSLLWTWIIHGTIQSTAHSSNGTERNLCSGNKP